MMLSRVRSLYAKWSRRVVRLCYGLPEVDLETIAPLYHYPKPPIVDDICLPPHYGPSDHDDFSPLMSIVAALQPRIVLELGTAHGNTVANICHLCPRTRVYTVNSLPSELTGRVITFTLTAEEIGRVYRANGFADRVVQIYQNTLHLDLHRFLRTAVVDLAIIDACHDFLYVLNDFHKVRP